MAKNSDAEMYLRNMISRGLLNGTGEVQRAQQEKLLGVTQNNNSARRDITSNFASKTAR